MSVPGGSSFSAPTLTVRYRGLLFDMDGTIIDSTEAVVKHWQRVGKEIGVDAEVILATSHGRRSIDVLNMYEPKLANWEYISHAEGLIPIEYGSQAVEIPGARALLDQLEQRSIPWCIVTSGTRPLVSGWLDVMKLAHPKNLVTAEDVAHGKPDPACYRMGQQKLELAKSHAAIIVFEDAPAGVRSGKAAGCVVVAVSTTHSTAQLQEAGADYIVRDLRSVRVRAWDPATGEGEVEIADALV